RALTARYSSPAPVPLLHLLSFPTRRSSDLHLSRPWAGRTPASFVPPRLRRPALGPSRTSRGPRRLCRRSLPTRGACPCASRAQRSEEHTSELQSLRHLVCRLLLEKKNKYKQ